MSLSPPLVALLGPDGAAENYRALTEDALRARFPPLAWSFFRPAFGIRAPDATRFDVVATVLHVGRIERQALPTTPTRSVFFFFFSDLPSRADDGAGTLIDILVWPVPPRP